MENFPQVSVHTSLQTRRDGSNLKRALYDHLMISEAAALAGDLLGQFPNARADMSDGFIGAMASILMQYPRMVVVKCANPLTGISREAKFLSIADLVAWLERQTEPLRRDIAREERIQKQFEEREEWQNMLPSERLKKLGKDWLDRTDPDAAKLAELSTGASAERRAATANRISEANESIFERECRQAGVDPARRLSPEMLKKTGEIK